MSIVRAPKVTSLGNLGTNEDLAILRLEATGLLQLDDLLGLSRLGQLYLIDNERLSDLQGLSQITRVARLEIRNNPQLTTLVGLSALTTISNWIRVMSNASIQTLEGLHHLESVGNEQFPVKEALFVLDDNPMLEEWRLDALREIHGNMQVTNHPMLRTCLIHVTHQSLETQDTELEAPSTMTLCVRWRGIEAECFLQHIVSSAREPKCTQESGTKNNCLEPQNEDSKYPVPRPHGHPRLHRNPRRHQGNEPRRARCIRHGT